MAPPAKRESLRSQLLAARWVLSQARIPNGWLDAEVLLAEVLRCDRAWLHGHPEHQVSAAQARRFQELVRKRAAHVPLAYLTREREFYGHSIVVSPAVLVPRPETEILVETAVQWLRQHPQSRRVIDLGTGSGAVAIAIARAISSIRVTAIDISAAARRVAQKNVRRHRLRTRIAVRPGDLLRDAPPADLIAANLPYLSTARRRNGGAELAFEPSVALDGGSNGLALIRRAIAEAPPILRRPGCLLLECDPQQAGEIAELARGTWAKPVIMVHQDLAGRDRVVAIEI